MGANAAGTPTWSRESGEQMMNSSTPRRTYNNVPGRLGVQRQIRVRIVLSQSLRGEFLADDDLWLLCYLTGRAECLRAWRR